MKKKHVSLSFFDDVADVYVGMVASRWRSYFWAVFFPALIFLIFIAVFVSIVFALIGSSGFDLLLENFKSSMFFGSFPPVGLLLGALFFILVFFYCFLRLSFGFVRQVLAKKPDQTLDGVWEDGNPFWLPLLRIIGFGIVSMSVIALILGVFAFLVYLFSGIIPYLEQFFTAIFIAGFVYIYFRIIFGGYLIIIEDFSIKKAFVVSWNMTKRYFWRLFFSIILLYSLIVFFYYFIAITLSFFGFLSFSFISVLFHGNWWIVGILIGVPVVFLLFALVFLVQYLFALILLPFYKVLLSRVDG